MGDKDWRLMLATLTRFTDEVVLTRVGMERSADPRILAAHLGGTVYCRVIEDARQAVNVLLENARPSDIVLVTGSLYLLGEVRPMLREQAGAASVQSSTLSAKS
jgi:dihydrofolate synthase/folylpolyglutamate synthase